MAEQHIINSKAVYEKLCALLDEIGWKYEKDEQKLEVNFSVVGDDIPMDFVCTVDEARQLIVINSALPVKFAPENRVDGAIVTCYINQKLVDGNFDYDYETGAMYFRMTSSYRGSIISRDMLLYMIEYACYKVDDYNDKLTLVANGLMSVETFCKKA